MQDAFGVGGGLEYGTHAFQLLAKGKGVRQVAVVRNRQDPVRGVDQERLGIPERRVTGGRIANVSDRKAPFERVERPFTENIRHKAQGDMARELRPVRGHNAGRFLSPVLQGIEPQIGKARGLRVMLDTHHTAFVMKMFIKNYLHAYLSRSWLQAPGKTLEPSAESLEHRIVLYINSTPRLEKIVGQPEASIYS